MTAPTIAPDGIARSLAGLAEKVAWTYVQSLAAFFLAADQLGIDGWQVAAVAALPAALTVIANGLPTISDLPFAADAAYRTVRTFAVTFIGALVAVPVFSLDRAPVAAAVTAGITAGITVIKSMAAGQIGDSDSAATLPSGLEPLSLVNHGQYQQYLDADTDGFDLPEPID